MTRPKHTYKDSIFRRLFNNNEEIIKLYNAVSGQNYPLDTDIQIVTLDNAIFKDRKNDLSFIIGGKLIILIEMQSTLSPNLALRFLVYIARQYEQIFFTREIYSTKQIKVPTPEFYVFYDGKQDIPLEQEVNLSDSFIAKCDKISLEMVVKIINVNYEKGARLLEECQTMAQYSQFIYLVRNKCHKYGDIETAIREAIKECIRNNVLKDFLQKNGGDIVSFLFEALTKEEMLELSREDGFEKGFEDGFEDGFAKGLSAGISQGQTALAALSEKLLESGREEDLKKALRDPDFMEQLYRELNLK